MLGGDANWCDDMTSRWHHERRNVESGIRLFQPCGRCGPDCIAYVILAAPQCTVAGSRINGCAQTNVDEINRKRVVQDLSETCRDVRPGRPRPHCGKC